MDWAGFTAAVCVSVCVRSEDGLTHVAIQDETHKSTSNPRRRRHSPYLLPLCTPGRFGREREKKESVFKTVLTVSLRLDNVSSIRTSHTRHIASLLGRPAPPEQSWLLGGGGGEGVFVFIRNSPNYPKHRLSKVLEKVPRGSECRFQSNKAPAHISLLRSSFKRSPALLKITLLLETLSC